MKFDINNYQGKFAMHCKTEEEAIDFCDYLNSIGRTSALGLKYKGKILWELYEDKLAINFNQGTQSGISYYHDANYIILEWEDFMKHTFTKADLKTGDVVLRRNGDIEIANCELKMFISKNGWSNFEDIRDDLTVTCGGVDWDIISVRRPIEKSDCQFNAYKYKWGTLVYERQEVEEMTLEQVCKLLGKEIKIIK